MSKEQKKELARAVRKPAFMGWIVVIAITVFFGGWAGFAPLEKAVIAPGSVMVGSNRKTIQHLEGGIISEILVRDGDQVQQGDKLIRLEGKSAVARQQSLVWHLKVEKTTEARLLAEQLGKKEIEFKGKIFENPDKDLKKIMEEQQGLLDVRMQAFEETIDIGKRKKGQFQSKINGYVAERNSTKEQIRLIEDELATVQQLFEKGLESKPRLTALQRKKAELQGRIGTLTSAIAETKEKISENELNITNYRTKFLNEVAEKLKETKSKIADLEDNLYASSDVYKRREIIAPQSGIVTGLRYHTVGGVIKPGEPILDIVPQDENLVIDAKLNPIDIDIVKQGDLARVMLSAYKTRSIPRVKGTVTYVSPDRFQDEATGEFYYKLTVEITEEELAKLKDYAENIELYPGMPAEVFIVTGATTLLQYLISPIKDMVRKGMRES